MIPLINAACLALSFSIALSALWLMISKQERKYGLMISIDIILSSAFLFIGLAWPFKL